jgi:hypothetical protein
MTRSKLILGTFAATAILGGTMLAIAQQPTGRATGTPQQPNLQTMFFETKIGSFKLVNGTGRVEIDFQGTMLISELQGDVVTSGNVKKEYDHDSPKKTGYHGRGKIIVTGNFKGIQWFGTDMKGKWTGTGLARMYGEFDKNQETGYYWYAHKPQKVAWYTHQSSPELPENVAKNPVPRGRGGSGSSSTGGG